MSGSPLVRIAAASIDRLRTHASSSAPEECCGVLVGSRRPEVGSSVRVTEARPVENVSSDPRRSYAIAPQELLEVDREARRNGLEVVGYYHSHPESAPRPSPRDLAAAWPDCVYLIVGVEAAAEAIAAVRCWRLAAAGDRFEPLALEMAQGWVRTPVSRARSTLEVA